MSKKKVQPTMQAAARDGHAAVTHTSNPFKRGRKSAKVEDLEEEEEEEEEAPKAKKGKAKARVSTYPKSEYEKDVAKVAAFKAAQGKAKPVATKEKAKPVAAKEKAKPVAAKGRGKKSSEESDAKRGLDESLRIKVLPAAKDVAYRGIRGEHFATVRKCKTVGEAKEAGVPTTFIRFYEKDEVIELT